MKARPGGARARANVPFPATLAALSAPLAVAAVVILVVGGLLRPATSAADERLPDLSMAPLEDFSVDAATDGRRYLRFSATIVNVGDGPLEIRGRRAHRGAAAMAVRQLVQTGGGTVERPTEARMTYAGDGHDHWHVHDVMRYDIWTDEGIHRASEKTGFCFWDNREHALSLPGAPADGVYPARLCGDAASLTNRMGLSVGWGDRYRSTLAWQWIEITGLPDGRYVVTARADPYSLFGELDTTNNCTAVTIDVQDGSVEVLAAHASCRPVEATIRADVSDTARIDAPRTVRSGCILALAGADVDLACPRLR